MTERNLANHYVASSRLQPVLSLCCLCHAPYSYASCSSGDVHRTGRIDKAIILAHILCCCSAGYSIWTNTNYKNPLIASAVACLLGNLCYCLSYDLGAVWLLFVARLITGFGEHDPEHSTAILLRHCLRMPGITLS